MPRRTRITEQHRRVFLAALAAGKTRGVAAREAHPELTGTRFRGLEHRDSKFASLVAAATREGALERLDKIDAEFDRRAFDPSLAGSIKALETLAATHHPDYLWLRRGGASSGEAGGLEAQIDAELLTRDQLAQLVELVKMGQGLIPNPELRAELEAAPATEAA